MRLLHHRNDVVECGTDVSDWAYGTEGIAAVGAEKPFITGKNPLKIKKSKQNMYDSEHVALFKSIRTNEPINNGDYMCKSTMAAIMARASSADRASMGGMPISAVSRKTMETSGWIWRITPSRHRSPPGPARRNPR